MKELKRIVSKANLTLLGDNYVRAGRILKFNQPNIGLIGEYLVNNCTHTYTGVLHTMTCEVEKQDDESK